MKKVFYIFNVRTAPVTCINEPLIVFNENRCLALWIRGRVFDLNKMSSAAETVHAIETITKKKKKMYANVCAARV